MSTVLPNRMLFRFEVPIHRCGKALRIDGRIDDWDAQWRLPSLGLLDGRRDWGQVYLTWDANGLYVACRVTGKSRPLQCDSTRFWTGDNFRLMTDMRDTRTIHRASRFCQHFYFLPRGGGDEGEEPVAGTAKVQRATQDAPTVPRGRIRIASVISAAGYTLTGHIPADCLSGFDPADNPRIGVYYMLEDSELGQQFLTVGDEMPWWVDPSLWCTAVLCP